MPVEAITHSINEMEPCTRDIALHYFLGKVKKTDGNIYISVIVCGFTRTHTIE